MQVPEAPVAAALVCEMVRQVAVELGVEVAGGTVPSAVAKGGKLFIRAGRETFELTAEKIATKLGKRVEDIDLNGIAKKLDGKTPDVCLAPKRAFEIAQDGGKHAGFLKNYIGKPASQLQKGIKSLENEIADHLDKIANPKRHIPGWDALDPGQQQALLNSKWPSDIARQREQLDILQGLSETLGGSP